jgi:hypothetical protein
MSIEIDFEKYKSVEGYKESNLFYKRILLDSVYTDWNNEYEDNGVDMFLESLQDLDYPIKHKKELIVERIFFVQIITLVDFLNPVTITFVMAKNFYFYELLKDNIKYSENPAEKLFSNFKQIDPKSFDWERDELNNYKFIISL